MPAVLLKKFSAPSVSFTYLSLKMAKTARLGNHEELLPTEGLYS
jgi:hypothetical protein